MSDRDNDLVASECFTTLLRTSLQTTSDDDVLVIYDESMNRSIDTLVTVACELGYPLTLINLRKAQQRHIVRQLLNSDSCLSIPELALPQPIKLALANSSVILNLLDGDLDTSLVRRSILRQPRVKECRLAHIPGLSPEIMQIVAATDFAQINEDCELLAWCLGDGGDATVETTSRTGQRYRLQLNLGTWANEPLMSPGVIAPGSWGNFPPAEVFCCPEPQYINGSICINGSIPDMPLSDSTEIVLVFRFGKLIGWSPKNQASEFFREQSALAMTRQDENWNTFCELGVGLNPRITSLTGNNLLDEKAAGTLHIAIGDNSPFGHDVKSYIHADLVTWRPSLSISGQRVLVDGVLQRSALHVLRRNTSMKPLEVEPNTRIRIKQAAVQLCNGNVKRRLYKGDRIGFVNMGNKQVSAALAAVHEVLHAEYDGVQADHFVSDYPQFDGLSTRLLLGYLDHYGCLLKTSS